MTYDAPFGSGAQPSEDTETAALLPKFTEARVIAARRRAAFDALPDEDKAFLAELRQAWFPRGKTEDYATVKRLLLESRKP